MQDRDLAAMARLGLAISGGLSTTEIVECVQLAEDLGYESAWVAERHDGDQSRAAHRFARHADRGSSDSMAGPSACAYIEGKLYASYTKEATCVLQEPPRPTLWYGWDDAPLL